ncbi:vWA domain-containing protein [Streptomyces sp. NPDC051320]|uniref:vWA domain-containing protein n=1 Tax=Streptomyces sp. NPDC051320 TaxID=3154644 RepID=UPI0034181B2D
MAGEDVPAAAAGRAELTALLEVSQIAGLPVPDAGTTARMYAVVTVTVQRTAGRAVGPPADAGEPPRHAVVFLIDHSSSMVSPPARMAAARDAAAAAVHALPDGTRFAVVAGRDRASAVYPVPSQAGPGSGVMAVADDATRRGAEEALRACHPGGGTAIGSWLAYARKLFARLPGDGTGFVCHALLLTDGRNEPGYETPEDLAGHLADCVDEFTCDAVGIGDAWATEELLLITGRLHGTAHAVERLDLLTEELRTLTREAADRTLTGLRLRLYGRTGVELTSIGQVHPTRQDLRTVAESPCVREFATAPWGEETRSYLLSLSVSHDDEPPGSEQMLTEVELARDEAARPTVALPPSEAVLVRWSGDHGLYSRVHPTVGHYLHQEELVRVFEEGCAALRTRNPETARRAFGRAWRLACQVGDDAMKEHLAKLITPGDDGEAELLDRIRPFDIEAARIRTSRTVWHR